jgi:hypothetical protein
MAGVTGILFTDVCCSLAFCLCLPHVLFEILSFGTPIH